MKNWRILLGAVWDNENTRLVRITEVTFPDGSYFITSGELMDKQTHTFLQLRCGSNLTDFEVEKRFPFFDWMHEENHSWLELTPTVVKSYFKSDIKWMIDYTKSSSYYNWL